MRMGQVGEPRREIIVEPEPTSVPVPEEVPEREPETAPA